MKITLKIPREIGEWIEYCKSCSITLYGALDPVDKFGMSIAETFKGDALKCAKWARINSFIVDYLMGAIDVELDCPLWVLELQLSTMNAYLTVLKKRIELGDTHEV